MIKRSNSIFVQHTIGKAKKSIITTIYKMVNLEMDIQGYPFLSYSFLKKVGNFESNLLFMLFSNQVRRFLCIIFCVSSVSYLNAQYKEFKISIKGDTINIIDKNGKKQGKWVNTVGELRGEPGYQEEGIYKNDKKEGTWRKYSNEGDLLAVEHYLLGGKDGVQDYYNYLGDLERHEEWRGFNPDAPYDTIAVYGEGNNEISSYKIIKAEPYSVKNGEWRYYSGGQLTKTEKYERGHLAPDDLPAPPPPPVAGDKPKAKPKTAEMLEYEKKYSKKQRAHMERDGKTGL